MLYHYSYAMPGRLVPAGLISLTLLLGAEGGPHNVEFIGDSLTSAARHLLIGAMGKDTVRALGGPWLIIADETYEFVVPSLPAGRYPWLCSPHFANMRGALIVEREK